MNGMRMEDGKNAKKDQKIDQSTLPYFLKFISKTRNVQFKISTIHNNATIPNQLNCAWSTVKMLMVNSVRQYILWLYILPVLSAQLLGPAH